MKLSPNVTDITEMARAAEAGGADVLSLINTLTGMKIDIHRRTFAIANRTGGMSGPAVKPVAVRMVYQTAQAVKLPIIGDGGHLRRGGRRGIYPGGRHGSGCGHRKFCRSLRGEEGGGRDRSRICGSIRWRISGSSQARSDRETD